MTHIAAATGCDLGQDANLGAEGADVGEAAQGVCGDQAGARRKIGVGWVGLQRSISDEFILWGE